MRNLSLSPAVYRTKGVAAGEQTDKFIRSTGFVSTFDGEYFINQ